MLPNEHVYIIGGAQVYRQALPLANRLEITLVHDIPERADTAFPNSAAALNGGLYHVKTTAPMKGIRLPTPSLHTKKKRLSKTKSLFFFNVIQNYF